MMKRRSNRTRKYFSRLASFLAVICCLTGWVIPENMAGLVSAAPRVVFENGEKASPDLYVAKEVESADPNYEIPDALKSRDFTFTLTVDGQLQKEKEFTLYEYREGGAAGSADDGLEVISKNGKIYVEVPPARPSTPYRTDRSGAFSLKAGQIAKFYIGNKKEYQVSEVRLDENFRLDRWENASGTMGKNGKDATFVNQWIPETAGETTKLQVKKTITFPERYEIPDTQLFPFQLELFGLAGYEPYAGKAYRVVDSKTGETVVIPELTDETGTARTDSRGIFYLKGGCTAVFQEVPTQKDYRVKEILTAEDISPVPEETEMPVSENKEQEEARLTAVLSGLSGSGWRPVGEQVREGTTTAPLTQEVFGNISAAFMVTKELENKEGQDEGAYKNTEFTFLLTRGEGELWSGAAYYLYNTTGVRADEETHFTAENGTFVLKPGQAAVFYNVPVGTVYGVKEESMAGFRQILPRDLNYYSNLTVEDTVKVHPFINEVKEPGGLSVTKKVINVKGEAAADGTDVFTFMLKDGEGNAVNTAYSISVGGSTSTYTAKEGVFTLKDGETADFAALPAGNYTVEEINLPPGYWFDHGEAESGENQSAAENKDSQPGIGENEEAETGGSQTGKEEFQETAYGFRLTDDGMDIAYYNNYIPDRIDLALTKMNNKKETLSGAAFKLFKTEQETDAQTGETSEKITEIGSFVTGNDGTLSIQGLGSGTYRLEETKAPEGYVLMKEPIEIVIDRTGKKEAAVTVNGISCTESLPEDDRESQDRQPCIAAYLFKEQPGENDMLMIQAYDDYLYELPHSGGIGIYWYLIGGVLLMMAAALILYKDKAKYAGRLR